MDPVGNARDILRMRLHLYWLRPERALFGASVELRGPLRPWGSSVELGCGDGLNTFLRLGGTLEPSFDYYAALEGEIGMAEYVEGKDVYDAPLRGFFPVKEKPGIQFHQGLDFKQNLLDRANMLGAYKSVQWHDLNTPLPYGDGTIDFVYSNVLYWLKDPDPLIAETARILTKGGEAVFEVLTRAVESEDFFGRFGAWGPEWCRLMDRGRFASYPGLRSLREWEAAFAGANLRVTKSLNVLPRGIFLVWHVGLRPIYPLLKRMIDTIPAPERTKIREEWVQTFFDLLYPVLIAPGVLADDGEEPLRVQFVLRK